MKMVKALLAAAISTAGLAWAAVASAAVTIDITQAGPDVRLTATGTFDSTLATRQGSNLGLLTRANHRIRAAPGFLGFGGEDAVRFFDLTVSTSDFGTGRDFYAITDDTGPGIGLNISPFSLGFFLSNDVADNAPFVSSGVVLGQSLTSMGLTAGVYRFAAGGNPITVSIGAVTPAIPEPTSWAMMVIGFGTIGAGMRRRRRMRVGCG